jgi:hypothetical protein
MWSILIALVAVGALVLAIPIHLRFRVDRAERASYRVHLKWLFGLVRRELKRKAPPAVPPTKPEAKRKRARHRRRRGSELFGFLVRVEGLSRALARFIRRVGHSLAPRDVALDVRLGLDDPADTGQLFGLLAPVVGVLASAAPIVELRVVPEFLEQAFLLHARGSIRIVPLALIAYTLALILSRPGLTVLWHLGRRGRR